MEPNTIRWEKHNIIPTKQSPRYKAFIYDSLVLDSADIELNSFVRDWNKRFPTYYPFLVLLEAGWQPIWLSDVIKHFYEYIGYECGLENDELYKVPEALNNKDIENMSVEGLDILLSFKPFELDKN